MDVLTLEPAWGKVQGKVRRAGRVQTVLRVARGELYVGDILLDADNRVWRHATTIPADVVLKALVGYSRGGDLFGKLIGRKDGLPYYWHVVGAQEQSESESVREEAA
jgi:hypothetical protein